MGFVSSLLDESLFIRAKEEIVYILVYVDDIVVTGSSLNDVEQCFDMLKSEFAVRICGDLDYFLGIRVREHADGAFLDQQLYLVNLLDKHGFDNLRPISTSMQQSGISL